MPTVKKLIPRNLTPVEDRSSFIMMKIKQGETYQTAVREYDKQKKGKK